MADYYKSNLDVLNPAIFRIKVKGIVNRQVYSCFGQYILSFYYQLDQEALSIFECIICDVKEYRTIINSLYKAHLPILDIELL
jgi:hypothetical protein